MSDFFDEIWGTATIQADPSMLLLTTIALLITTFLSIGSIVVTGYYAHQMMKISKRATDVSENQLNWQKELDFQRFFATFKPDTAKEQKSNYERLRLPLLASYTIIAKSSAPTSATFQIKAEWLDPSPITEKALLDFNTNVVGIHAGNDAFISNFGIRTLDSVSELYHQDVSRKHYDIALAVCLIRIYGTLTMNGESRDIEFWRGQLSTLPEYSEQFGVKRDNQVVNIVQHENSDLDIPHYDPDFGFN